MAARGGAGQRVAYEGKCKWHFLACQAHLTKDNLDTQRKLALLWRMDELTPTPLSRALKAAGGPAELARKLGISSQAVSQWERIPGERTLAVEDITGIPAHELRPDLYRAPRSESAA